MSIIDRRFLDVTLTVNGIVNEPAANPTAGTQYIVGEAGTGAFADIAANSIARYDGSAWKFIAPNANSLEVFNANTGEILRYNGSMWVAVANIGSFKYINPVLGILLAAGTHNEDKPKSASIGDKYLETDYGHISVVESTDKNGIATWSWEATRADQKMIDGDRYACLADFKIYSKENGVISATNIPDNAIFFNKADNCLYIYDTAASSLTKIGGSTSADTTSETVTEVHTLTEDEVTAKSFSLANSIATGKESNVLLFVCGVAQIVGIDFTASGNSISWSEKGLDDISLAADDIFIIHYVKG